jgi:hypothetical protein
MDVIADYFDSNQLKDLKYQKNRPSFSTPPDTAPYQPFSTQPTQPTRPTQPMTQKPKSIIPVDQQLNTSQPTALTDAPTGPSQPQLPLTSEITPADLNDAVIHHPDFSKLDESDPSIIHPTLANTTPLSFGSIIHPADSTTNKTVLSAKGSADSSSTSAGASVVEAVPSQQPEPPKFTFVFDDPTMVVNHPFEISDENPFLAKPVESTIPNPPVEAQPLIKTVQSQPSKFTKRFY